MVAKIHLFYILAGLLFAGPLFAAKDPVFELEVARPVDQVYPAVYKSLEAARFYVVFEPDIGANLSGFAGRWGEDYNRNDLSAIRSMVFCNA